METERTNYTNDLSKLSSIQYLQCSCITVGKHTPCKLSFLYTSYIRYGVRAAPKLGKHASLFSYHNE